MDSIHTCPLWTGVDGIKEVCRTSSLPSQLLLWNFRGLASEERGGDTSPHMLFHQNCSLFLLMSGRKPASFSGTVYRSASLRVWPLCDHIIVWLSIASISMLLWKVKMSCRSPGTFAQEWCVLLFCVHAAEMWNTLFLGIKVTITKRSRVLVSSSRGTQK